MKLFEWNTIFVKDTYQNKPLCEDVQYQHGAMCFKL